MFEQSAGQSDTRDPGINPNMLARWCRELGTVGSKAFVGQGKPRDEELAALRRELAQKQRAGNQALGIMNEHLADRSFFVGESYTIADIALYAYTHVAGEGGFDLSQYPAVVALPQSPLRVRKRAAGTPQGVRRAALHLRETAQGEGEPGCWKLPGR